MNDPIKEPDPTYDDWDHREAARKLNALFANLAYVQPVGDGLLRINFGESADEEPSYHTAIVMSGRNVLDLAQLLHRMGMQSLGLPVPMPAPSPIPTPSNFAGGENGGS